MLIRRHSVGPGLGCLAAPRLGEARRRQRRRADPSGAAKRTVDRRASGPASANRHRAEDGERAGARSLHARAANLDRQPGPSPRVRSNDIDRSMPNAGRLGPGRIGAAYPEALSNRCDRALQLIAEVDGERAAIGSLKAGAGFEPGAADEASKLTAVSPELPWLQLASGARLWRLRHSRRTSAPP